MRREAFKDVTLKGRKWRIGKFNPLVGSFLVLGIFPKLKSATDFSALSREEFSQLQRDCLMVCSEVTVVGDKELPVPVMTAGGEWSVKGIEDDLTTVLGLTIHAIQFNMSFFGEDALEELESSIKNSTSANASI